jgi:serine/threonine-protein kinase
VAGLGSIGKYELLKRIAIGGMAEIFLARQTGVEGFEKLVVIKKILPHLAAQERFVQMFLNEARLAARFNHPNIAQIYDLGQQDQAFFIAMEYVHGEDIKAVVRRCASLQRRIPIEHVVKVFSGVLDGLHFAHTQLDADGRTGGVVHRDVSPHNIIVAFQGGVKVVDFGIAKARSQISTTLPGRVKGKHAYMSPEQCQGLDLDGRSDVFSVGIVMYELITWSRLFKRKHDLETLKAITQDDIPPMRYLRPDLDPALEAIVMRALSREREQRFQTAQEMQLALEDYLVTKGLKTNSALISHFMEELFAEKLALRNKALAEAKVANLEGAVLASGDKGPDLVAFLNMFFGESTSGSESTSSGANVQMVNQPEFTPSGEFTPAPDPSQRSLPPRAVPQPQFRKDGTPIKPPPPLPPDGLGSVVHVAPGKKKKKTPALTAQDVLPPVAAAPAKAPAEPSGPADPLALFGNPSTAPVAAAEPVSESEFLLESADPFTSKPARKSTGLIAVLIVAALAIGAGVFFVKSLKESSTPPPKGAVKVISVPPGADVFVDDIKQEGKTPLELSFLPDVEHLLRIEAENHPTWEQKFTVTDVNTPMEIKAVFEKDALPKSALAGKPIIAGAEGQGKGSIRVESDPPGALIYLDGISLDKRTPTTLRGLPAGLDHVILLEMAGKLWAAERVSLAADAEAQVKLVLQDGEITKESRTEVRIESEPEGAKVIVNEWPLKKKTPVTVKLLDGAYNDLALELPGHQRWTRVVRPVPGVDLTFLVKLKKGK